MSAVNEKKIDSLLARFFSESGIRSLMSNSKSPSWLLQEFYSSIRQTGIKFEGRTYKDLYEFAYSRLLKNYRSEYIYKNVLANKILLGKHSLNTSFMLQEFRVGQCKADTLILNGTSNIYEIKTELDSLDRLSKQVETYLQVVDMVHIITFPGQGRRIDRFVPPNVGIMELTHRNSISTIREATSGRKNISTAMLFDSLRKSEYRAIIKQYYGYIPKVSNTEEYRVCRELFIPIEPAIAHDLAVIELKKRGNKVALKDFVRNVPDCLRSLSLSARFSTKETIEINKLLESDLCLA